MDLLSSLYCLDVNGVNAVSMDSVDVSVRIQRQTEDPLEIQRGEEPCVTGRSINSYHAFKAQLDYQNKIIVKKTQQRQITTKTDM